jgi:hypothetical protein
VTGIGCGELVAPVPETVIEVVYVPAESPVTLAVTATDPAPVPAAGDMDSHGTGLEALQVNVPVPVLLILTVWTDGLLPPWIAEKLRLVGARPMVGTNGALTINVTITVCGVFVAPVAAMLRGAV